MVFLAIEASKPSREMYRLAIGCNLYPMASWFVSIGQLL